MGEQEHYIDQWPAWLIAVYACLTIALHNGILNCGALFYPSLMETFGHPISVVSWLVTGQYAVTYCLSPFYNRMIDYIPNRIAITVAVLLTTGSLIASSLVNDFWSFLVLYTIVGGIGLGVSVVRAVSIAAEYFDRYRILALALCSSGTGLGTFVYSKIGAYMMDIYTWRIALIGFALLHLHMIAIGLLLKPLPTEAIPEPTVLIPHQPDLNACDLPANLVEQKNESRQNLFLSIMSVNSVHGNSTGYAPAARNRSELGRRNTIVSNIRVVIEFVKATRYTGPQSVVCLDSITFLPDPGARVLKQLEDAAQDALFEENIAKDQVMIPMLFIVSDFDVIQMDTQDPISGSQLKFFLDSRFDLYGTNERLDDNNATSKQPRPVPVADSFTSSMAVLQDRRRKRRTIRAVIERGQEKVKRISEELEGRGLYVYPNPVVALIDQNVGEPGNGQVSFAPSGDHTYLWSNLALDSYAIPEEIEPMERITDKPVETNDNRTELTKDPLLTEKTNRPERDRPRMMRKPSQAQTSQLIGSRQSIWPGRLNRSGSTKRPFDSVLIQSSTELTRGKSGAFQPRDIFASVLSIATAHEAMAVLESKYLDEWKSPVVTATGDVVKEKKSKPFLLADMLFLTFLLTRLLVFLADSIVFAHLSNFAITSGYDPDSAAGLLSFIGIASMLSRMGTGIIGQFLPGMELRCLTASCLLILAIYTILMPLYPTYVALAVYSVVYGILASPSFAFAPSIAYDVVGPSRYDEAIAFVYQFEAFGYLIGGPIGGAIKEVNNNYFECFAFCGLNNLTASVILFTQSLIMHGIIVKSIRLLRSCLIQTTK